MEVARKLIEGGADTDLATLDFGATALQIAAQNGHAEVVFFLGQDLTWIEC